MINKSIQNVRLTHRLMINKTLKDRINETIKQRTMSYINN